MKSIFTTILSILLFVSYENYGQIKPSISNIRAKVTNSGLIEIQYDVSGIIREDSIYILLLKKDGTSIKPKSVSGDIARGVTNGINKLIKWNIVDDNFIVDDDFQIIIEIKLGKEIQAPKPSGGVSNVLLSMIAPGVGNIFVNENKKIGFRPLITASFYGLLIYGLTLKSQSNSQYAIYNSKTKETEAQTYYDAANENHHSYFVMTRGAAVIWVYSVISTAIKGVKNDKLRKQSNTTFKIGTFMDTPTIGLNYKF